MRARALAVLGLGCVFACGPSSDLTLEPTDLTQSGGELRIIGTFAPARGVVVLIDGVAAHAVVRESQRVLRVRVPALPRTGPVDVELHAADGTYLIERDALVVSAPRLQVEPQ